MLYLQAFLLGLVFSFVGSIPPGTLNICVLQLGLKRKINTAIKFTIAVAIIEYPYAWIAIRFEDWITSSAVIVKNFQLITAVVMIVLGIFMLIPTNKSGSFTERFNESGFRRGLILSILNPLAIPFWIGVTAYLKSQHWIDISSTSLEHSYIFGTSVGVLLLLLLYIFLAQKLAPYLEHSKFVKAVPAIMLLGLGFYALGKYFFL